jgi:hypothetical protein
MKTSMLLLVVGLALAGCARGTSDTTSAVAVAPPVVEAPALAQAAPADPALPKVLMHRDPSCGCCGAWAEHMRAAGFEVEIRDEPDMVALKRQLGIPDEHASCHTAEIDGYVVEGHVPAEDVKRFLAEKPEAKGLLLPGMPLGSPGMEAPGAATKPYTVERLEADGRTTEYATHGG